MSFEKIGAAVIAEANVKAQEIIDEAQKERDTALARFREESAKKLEEAKAQAETAAVRETSRLKGLARHEGRLDVLKVKNQILTDIFTEAVDKVLSLPESEYAELMATWVKRLSLDIGGTLRVSPRDSKLFTPDFLKRLNSGRASSGVFTGVVPDASITGGFVVDGSDFMVNVTIERKINELRESLSGDLAKELFGS